MRLIDFRVLGVNEAKRKFGAVLRGLPEARLKEMRWLMREGLKIMREEAPERTGALKRGFQARTTMHDPTTTSVGWFATNAGFTGKGKHPNQYVRWVVKGRGPVHAIRAKMLRFEPGPPGTGFIYRKDVGPAPANPFDARTIERLRGHPIVVARNIAIHLERIFNNPVYMG